MAHLLRPVRHKKDEREWTPPFERAAVITVSVSATRSSTLISNAIYWRHSIKSLAPARPDLDQILQPILHQGNAHKSDCWLSHLPLSRVQQGDCEQKKCTTRESREDLALTSRSVNKRRWRNLHEPSRSLSQVHLGQTQVKSGNDLRILFITPLCSRVWKEDQKEGRLVCGPTLRKWHL